MEGKAVRRNRYGMGSICDSSSLDCLRFRIWPYLEDPQSRPPIRFETSVRCMGIGSEKVRLEHPVSSSREHRSGRSLAGCEMSPETAKSLPYTLVSVRMCWCIQVFFETELTSSRGCIRESCTSLKTDDD
jgi:hypothetical protein